jgi:hypothetical protein
MNEPSHLYDVIVEWIKILKDDNIFGIDLAFLLIFILEDKYNFLLQNCLNRQYSRFNKPFLKAKKVVINEIDKSKVLQFDKNLIFIFLSFSIVSQLFININEKLKLFENQIEIKNMSGLFFLLFILILISECFILFKLKFKLIYGFRQHNK